MRLTPSLRPSGWLLGALGASWLLGGVAFGLATGIPISLTIEPATIRQHDKETTPVVVRIALQSPSPAFFICELRSADARKINFTNIIFKKGETQGQGQGTVQWKFVPKDSRVRITAFSVDAPDRQLSFTVALKPKAAEETTDAATQ